MRFHPFSPSAAYIIPRACQIRSYTASQAPFEPLRILFCGSDEFSIASLRALHKEHERDKTLIESIDVVCRPAKPVGRGLKDRRQGKFGQAPFFVPVLNWEQYLFPGLQRNWPCLYIILTHSPSGRSVHHSFTGRFSGVEMNLAPINSWLAHKFDHCRLVWSFGTSTNTSRGQIWRAQCPPFDITSVRDLTANSPMVLSNKLMYSASTVLPHCIIPFYLDAKRLE